MNRLFIILPFLFLFLRPAASNAQTEAGSLAWFTDLNKAIDASNSSKKPIFENRLLEKKASRKSKF
jgi:hypothetical protein